MTKENSISILRDLLVELSESNSPDETVKVELAKITKNPRNDSGFSKAILDFTSIFKDAEKTILTSENNSEAEDFIETLNEINFFFFANNAWEIKVNTFNNWIKSRNILRYLRLAARNIEQEEQKIIFEDAFLKDLLEQIHSIEEEVLSSETSENLKVFILSKLREMSWAIENHHIYGAKSIKVAAGSVFSEIFNKIQGRELSNEDKRNKYFTRFTSLVWTILIINATAIEPLLGTISFITMNGKKYLQPNIEEVLAISLYLEDAMDKTDDLGNAIEAGYSKLYSPQELIEGREPKLLEPGQDP